MFRRRRHDQVRTQHGEPADEGARYLLRARDTMAIERGGDTIATVKKAIIAPLRERFTVQLAGGEELEAQGNILDHEYQITRSGIPLANISKRWFRVRKSYGVAVAPVRTTRWSWPSRYASTTSSTRLAAANFRRPRIHTTSNPIANLLPSRTSSHILHPQPRT